MDNKMKVAIVGTGRMGGRHIEAALKQGFDVVGICDLQTSALEKMATDYPVLKHKCFTSYAEMLEVTKPNAVVVATTAPSHCELVLKAATSAVKYILCEKPMASSISDCRLMIETCERHKVILSVNHQKRFITQYKLIKEIISKDELGEFRGMIVSTGNVGLAMNGSHYLELFSYLSKQNIASVQFWKDDEKHINPRGPQYTDISGQLRATTPKGHRFFMELGGDLGHGVQTIYNFKYGQVFNDELACSFRTIKRKIDDFSKPTSLYGLPSDNTIKELEKADIIKATQDIWDSMMNDNKFTSGLDGLRVIKALVAANISAEEGGKEIRLEDIELSTRKFSWA
jgi:predicted dehydrogenase